MVSLVQGRPNCGLEGAFKDITHAAQGHIHSTEHKKVLDNFLILMIIH